MLKYHAQLAEADGQALGALSHFAGYLTGQSIPEERVAPADLDQYLYALALEGANSARLDAAVHALKVYFAYRVGQEGGADPAAGLSFFGGPENAREKYIKSEWSMSDAFYGISPDRGRSGGA